MNVEIGAEAALFPEKEYINGIAVAVHLLVCVSGQLFWTGEQLAKWGFLNTIIDPYPSLAPAGCA
jgi:hypothetical protein